MSSESHAIAQLTSPSHPRIVPQTVIDDVVEVLAERDAEETELRKKLAEEKLRRERAEFNENKAREDLSECRGQLRTAHILIRQYRAQLGIDDV